MASIPSDENIGLTQFSYSLFTELATFQDGNLFASPYSIQLLLLLLAFGSKGNTSKSLMPALRISKENLKKINNSSNLHEALFNIQDTEFLNIANGIFVDEAFPLNKEFENIGRNYLNSEVKNVDFFGNFSASGFNAWTSNFTNGKITKLIKTDTFPQETMLVLTSIVNFKNDWEKEFVESKMGRFCLSSTNHIQANMMHLTEYFPYYKDEKNKFAAIELPYNGGDFQMLVVLPDVMDGIIALEQSFLRDPTNFNALLGKLETHKVVLTLPKFKFESDLDLETAIRNLCCVDIFTSHAELSGIYLNGPRNLKVSEIVHKSFIEVNEKGTEAFRVTGAANVTEVSNPPSNNTNTVNFKACHPFLFFIKQNSKIIFMGRLANPNA